MNKDTKEIKDEEIPVFFKIHKDNLHEVVMRTNVVGTTFIKDSDKVLRFLQTRVPKDCIIVKLDREPENLYDSKAVSVNVTVHGAKKTFKLGYISRDKNDALSYALDHEKKYYVNIFDIFFSGGDSVRENIGMFFSYAIRKLS